MNVAFVAPFGMDTTLRFVRAAAALSGVRLGLVSQEPAERIPGDLRASVAAFEQVSDALDAAQLAAAARAIAGRFGGRLDRLIGVLEQLQVPLAEAREQLGLPGMSAGVARNFREKARMKDVFRAAGVPCARHALAKGAAEAASFGDRSGYPLVVKPPAGAGARNTFRVETPEQLEGYLRSSPPQPGAPVLLEEFIQGEEHSFDSVTLGGRHLFHSISRYFPTPLEVIQTPWIQWCVLLPRRIDGPEFEPIRAAGTKALAALGLVSGLTHMEWFRRGDGSVAISEVAARPPGAQFTSLLSWAHDLDFYRAWAELAVFERFAPPARSWACGAAYLRGQGRGRVVAVRGIEQVQRELGALIVEAKLPEVGQAPAGSYEGEGYVILRHRETGPVEEGLRRVVECVRVDLGELG